MRRIRSPYFRVALATIAAGAAIAIHVASPESVERKTVLTALQATTLIFTVCAATSLVLYSSHIKGLREAYLKQVAKLRDMVEKLYDENKNVEDPARKKLVQGYLKPLLNLSSKEWIEFNPMHKLRDEIEKPARRIHKRDGEFLIRHLLRLEDELNELGTLFIRRVLVQLHMGTISGAFRLIAFSVFFLGFAYLVPQGSVGDLICILVAASIVSFAVLELLLVVSYIEQEASEESQDAFMPKEIDA